MSNGPRIPRTIILFNPYLANTADYLMSGTPTTNADRLGVLPVEVEQWQAFVTAWVPIYTKYIDKKNSRTTSIKD